MKKLSKSERDRIRRENKKFMALKPAEKRVQIARDVIAQLDAKRLVAKRFSWLRPDFRIDELAAGTDLQPVFAASKRCVGCAIGGLFMCAVERANDLKAEDMGLSSLEDNSFEGQDAMRYLRRFFTKDQINMIETAFESGGGGTFVEDGAKWLACKNYFGQNCEIADPETRMRLIMQNIIVNKGTFDPAMTPVSTWTVPGFSA